MIDHADRLLADGRHAWATMKALVKTRDTVLGTHRRREQVARPTVPSLKGRLVRFDPARPTPAECRQTVLGGEGVGVWGWSSPSTRRYRARTSSCSCRAPVQLAQRPQGLGQVALGVRVSGWSSPTSRRDGCGGAPRSGSSPGPSTARCRSGTGALLRVRADRGERRAHDVPDERPDDRPVAGEAARRVRVRGRGADLVGHQRPNGVYASTVKFAAILPQPGSVNAAKASGVMPVTSYHWMSGCQKRPTAPRAISCSATSPSDSQPCIGGPPPPSGSRAGASGGAPRPNWAATRVGRPRKYIAASISGVWTCARSSSHSACQVVARSASATVCSISPTS